MFDTTKKITDRPLSKGEKQSLVPQPTRLLVEQDIHLRPRDNLWRTLTPTLSSGRALRYPRIPPLDVLFHLVLWLQLREVLERLSVIRSCDGPRLEEVAEARLADPVQAAREDRDTDTACGVPGRRGAARKKQCIDGRVARCAMWPSSDHREAGSQNDA